MVDDAAALPIPPRLQEAVDRMIDDDDDAAPRRSLPAGRPSEPPEAVRHGLR